MQAFWLQPTLRKTNNGTIQCIRGETKVSLTFTFLWPNLVCAVLFHLLNKPTNKICFNLKNNTVCYYCLLFFDKPIFLYSLHTHACAHIHAHLHTLHWEYISQKYTHGTKQSLSKMGCFHNSNDHQGSVWAHGFPVPQIKRINWSNMGRLCVRDHPKANDSGRACFFCLNEVVLTVGHTLFVKGVLSDTWCLEGEIFIPDKKTNYRFSLEYMTFWI